jgi:hypothetical protein
METNLNLIGSSETLQMVEEITLGGQSVRLVHRDIPLEDVKLDRRNQRIQYFLATSGGKADDQELEKKLWEIPDVKALYRSILQNEGLVERIIVQADGTVVEGNCRTVCYRKLHKEFPVEPRWAKIPTRVLPLDIEPKLLAILLGEMHVAGKNKWTAYEKAAYVYHMNEELGFSLDYLSEHLRSSKATIKKLLDAFKLCKEQFLVKYPDPKNVYKFSYFEEFYKKFKKSDPDLERDFVDWVGKDKLNEGMQVRDLVDIVAHPTARKALSENGYSAAMMVLEAVDPSYASAFFGAIDWMVDQFKKAPAEDIKAVRDGDEARIAKVKALHQSLKDFSELANLDLSK